MAVNTTTTLSGLFKTVYGDKVHKLVPENAVITKMIKFAGKKSAPGSSFKESVSLALEQGATYAAPGAGAYSYNTPVPGAVRQATVDGYQLSFVADLDFETATKAMSANSKQAFAEATQQVISNLTQSHRHRLETNFLYGGVGIGAVSGLASQVITFTAASWAEGIWAGQEGAKIDVYQADLSTLRQADLVIASIDMVARTVTVVGTTTGIVATDVAFFAGSNGNEAIGIDSIITTSGSLFGIDNSAYSLWAGNSYAVGGALTQAKVDNAITLAVAKGFAGGAKVLVNPAVWSDLNVEQTARRTGAPGMKRSKSGYNFIEYFSVSGGVIELVPSSCVKLGEGFVIPSDTFKRIGTVDFTLGDPLNKDGMVQDLEGSAGYRIKSYSNQAMFCTKPGHAVKLTGITS